MMKDTTSEHVPLCPSAQSSMSGSVIFAVVGGTPERAEAAYLNELLPINESLLSIAAPAQPGEVFRIAAHCAESSCKHFGDGLCRLAERTVALLPEVVYQLPACQIRSDCRWWKQEGKAACLRCPQVVTENHNPSELAQLAAAP
jgi:hypothetical protein